ncbi:PAS domain-containing protein [Nisaea sediminum]|uniref:hypothetical protein n=1 Tax=Nisaea sediminum TaxID=2775867 RepID=UPI001866E6A8|nr:hypothetical protein [Nisaea sediminum]
MDARPVLGETLTATEAYDVEIIQWEFEEERMTPRQRQLYGYWSSRSGAGKRLSVGEFDPLEIRASIGYLHLVQYDADRNDFFYRIYGEMAARSAKAGMHRKWVGNHPGRAGAKFLAHYMELMAERAPWLGEVYTKDSIKVAPYWRRMVLPLEIAGHPDGFACATLAEPRDSPDPRG